MPDCEWFGVHHLRSGGRTTTSEIRGKLNSWSQLDWFKLPQRGLVKTDKSSIPRENLLVFIVVNFCLYYSVFTILAKQIKHNRIARILNAESKDKN